MLQIDFPFAVKTLKGLTFSKSWQNSFVSKAKKLLNRETNKFEESELGVFVFIPAPTLVHHFGSNKDFLTFRLESKSSRDWDYKLMSDAVENNNRRLAIMYVARALDYLEINFTIDDSYTLYINEDELKKLSQSESAELRDFYNSLYIPKTSLSRKVGTSETWS